MLIQGKDGVFADCGLKSAIFLPSFLSEIYFIKFILFLLSMFFIF